MGPTNRVSLSDSTRTPQAPQSMNHLRRLTVFTSARASNEPRLRQVAREVGKAVGNHGLRLLYGGSSMGLMHEVAHAATVAGAEVWAVFPGDVFLPEEQAAPSDETLVDTGDLATRKDFLIHNCDGVLVLPGGWGTLDELFEALTLMQVGQREWMPVVLLDVDGFWAPLREWIAHHQLAKGLVSSSEHALLHCVTDPEEALRLIDQQIPALRHAYAQVFGTRGLRLKVETDQLPAWLARHHGQRRRTQVVELSLPPEPARLNGSAATG